MYPWYNVMKMALYLCDLSPKNLYKSSLIMGGKKHQIPTEEHPIIYLTCNPQKCQGRQKQEESEHCHSQKEHKEI